MLVDALRNSFDMSPEDAKELTTILENVFNGESEVEHLSLDKATRALFYDLYQYGFLAVRREEIDMFRKLYYWSFNYGTIQKLAYLKPHEPSPYAIYEKLPEERWYR